jgi:hypothetical protein
MIENEINVGVQVTNEEFALQFNQALEWTKSLQNVHPSSRYEKYLKIINQVGAVSRNDDGRYSHEELESLQNKYGVDAFEAAIFEGAELIEVYQVLGSKQKNITIPEETFKRVVSGVINARQETGNHTTEARNTLFELFCASMIAKSGIYKPKLTDKPNTPDISFNHNRFKVFVECKRINSAEAFEANLRKAYKQLGTAYEQHKKNNILKQTALGIVMMSITKVINPKQQILETSDYRNARQRIRDKIFEIYKSDMNVIGGRPLGTVGLISFARIPVMIDNKLLTYRYSNPFPLVLERDGAWDVFNSITKTLQVGQSTG